MNVTVNMRRDQVTIVFYLLSFVGIRFELCTAVYVQLWYHVVCFLFAALASQIDEGLGYPIHPAPSESAAGEKLSLRAR